MNKEQIKLKKELEKDSAELEKLLIDDDIGTLLDEPSEVLPSKQKTSMNAEFLVEKARISEKSGDIVNSLYAYYVSRREEKDPYLKERINLDRDTLASFLFQTKTSEYAIMQLIDEIESGNRHPRAFEVLSTMQKGQMEIIKHQAQFLVTLEDMYKRIKEDQTMNRTTDTSLAATEETGGVKVKGTKELFKQLRAAQEDLMNQKIQTVDYEESERYDAREVAKKEAAALATAEDEFAEEKFIEEQERLMEEEREKLAENESDMEF